MEWQFTKVPNNRLSLENYTFLMLVIHEERTNVFADLKRQIFPVF